MKNTRDVIELPNISNIDLAQDEMNGTSDKGPRTCPFVSLAIRLRFCKELPLTPPLARSQTKTSPG